MPGPHDEGHFEAVIAGYLGANGWEASIGDAIDHNLALHPEDLDVFLEATQQPALNQLSALVGGPGTAKAQIRARLAREIDQRATVDVLRHGVREHGIPFRLAYFRPAHGLTPQLELLYQANRLRVVQQLRYAPGHENRLDLAFFLNGLPVATAEVKQPLTNQDVRDAIEQYRTDRDPKDKLLGRRALVHFAVDPDQIYMTTRLQGPTTDFLPFNEGSGGAGAAGGKGNPSGSGIRTAYLWEQVLDRNAWLDLLHRFVLVTPPKPGDKRSAWERPLIFPRFHQWHAVRQLEQVAATEGPGHNYLIQHSTGSGKTNTISWLSHRLARLHDADGSKVFRKVVVLTDRVVLDDQLQKAIKQIEHVHGVVRTIRGSSAGLATALQEPESQIVVSTIQKFPYILGDITAELGDHPYAVIIDEAHSSQGGEAATAVKVSLGAGRSDDELLGEYEAAAAEQDQSEITRGDPQDALVNAVRARGHQPNLSFFAFTATPKATTLELFGRKPPGATKAVPFHVYSMRQAIEEGFIMDVLASYVTYAVLFKLEKAASEDPELPQAKASKAIARFASLHPHVVEQKAEVIVEHFRRHVANRIGGRAKAMVVTRSRLHAVRYKLAIDAYLAKNGYTDTKALVAFSGEVLDEVAQKTFTESGMNDAPESRTADLFDTDEYQLLLVAEKFQTGYSQPLLHTMYVDRPLTGLKAVQTLSRLNRIHPEKRDTLVLDFVNNAEDIQAAYANYYERTVAEPTDLNLVYDAEATLGAYDILHQGEIDAFAAALYGGLADAPEILHVKLDPAVDRWLELEAAARVTFKADLDRFVSLYAFLSQLLPLGDTGLEKLYAYAKFLTRKLPMPEDGALDLGEEVRMTHLAIELADEHDVSLDATGDRELHARGGDATGASAEDKVARLSEIIARINEVSAVGISEEHRFYVERIATGLTQDEQLREQALANSLENFLVPARAQLMPKIIAAFEDDKELLTRVLSSEELQRGLQDHLLPEIYRRIREEVDERAA